MSLIKELMRERTVDLVRLVIAYYIKKYGRGVSAESLVKLLFLILYTTEDGGKLLDAPRIRLPEEFRIYPKGPFIPIDRVLGGEIEMGKYSIVKTGDKYYVKDLDKAFEESYRALKERGLGSLADYAVRIIDKYGGLEERELIEHALNVLGLRNEVAKAMAFNMNLDAYIDATKRLKRVLESKESINEEELYPDIF